MFISYDVRNGVEYAKLCISKRNGKTVSKSYIYLGKVVDKEKFIFFNKDRGLFNYNPVDNSYTSLNSQSNIYAQDKPSIDLSTIKKNSNDNDDKKINDIEFQRAKFDNELPKINDTQQGLNIFNFEQQDERQEKNPYQIQQERSGKEDDIKDDYEDRLELLKQDNELKNVQQNNFYSTKQENFNTQNQNFNYQRQENTKPFFPQIPPKETQWDSREMKTINHDIEFILKNTIPFGDVDFVKKIIEENQISDVIDLINVANKDLLYVLIFHNILGGNSSDIQFWYDHSFIKYIYPDVDCTEQNIYEELESQEEKVFSLYQQNVVKKLDLSTINTTNILGDTRLLINHEGIPLCSIDSKSDLQDTINYLNKNEIFCSQFIVNVDEIYNTDANLKLIANVREKDDLYDIILDSYSVNNLEFMKFGDVFYQICKKQIQYEQYNLYTYTFCDILKQSQRTIQTLSNFYGDVQNFNMIFDNVIISNADFDKRKILEIIKMNDPFKDFVFKSKSSIINFISAIIIAAMSRGLKINFYDALMILKNVKCFVDVHNNKHVMENFDYSNIFSY